MSDLNPFLLAATTPDPDPRLLPLLRMKPALASAQDVHGYSLLHAAASYSHLDLLRTLVTEFEVDVNLKDEDDETCLFVAETLDIAKCLVDELRIDTSVINQDGQTAGDKFEAENEFPEIAIYLRMLQSNGHSEGPVRNSTVASHPPPLPANVTVDIQTVTEPTGAEEQEPDPVFRSRIEELAGKENLQSEEGQRELRQLVTDAVRGVGDDREVRRRTE